MNEMAFCHRASRTLVLTDAAFNLFERTSRLERWFFRIMGVRDRLAPSRMFRTMIRDGKALREALDRVLTWDFDRIIVSHGIVLQRSGKRLLREAYVWLD